MHCTQRYSIFLRQEKYYKFCIVTSKKSYSIYCTVTMNGILTFEYKLSQCTGKYYRFLESVFTVGQMRTFSKRKT